MDSLNLQKFGSDNFKGDIILYTLIKLYNYGLLNCNDLEAFFMGDEKMSEKELKVRI